MVCLLLKDFMIGNCLYYTLKFSPVIHSTNIYKAPIMYQVLCQMLKFEMKMNRKCAALSTIRNLKNYNTNKQGTIRMYGGDSDLVFGIGVYYATLIILTQIEW